MVIPIVAAICCTAACARNDTGGAGSSPLPSPAATTTSTTTTTLVPTGLAPFTFYAPDTLPADAAAIASELTQVETQLAEADLEDAEREALAHRQQAAYRILTENSSLVPSVLDSVSSDSSEAIKRNAEAATDLAGVSAPSAELPAWSIIAPAPAAELLDAYKDAASTTGIDWEYLAAINFIETRMGRVSGTSSAGAQGPMQFEPETWEEYGDGGDIDDPRDAIMAAARFLADNGAAQDIGEALLRYNRSDAYVRAVESYAANIVDDSTAFLAYYYWQVYYESSNATIVLDEGYSEAD